MSPLPTKVVLPTSLLQDLDAEAKLSSRKRHNLCILMIDEGIRYRESLSTIVYPPIVKKEKTNGVFA